MVPSKSKRSESRRSSILKPRKPRQPLQSVNFDSSSNESSPAASKVKRRVSFAEKKHVKEFCHSTEQGTVWDNTYEEHDSSLKESFVVDQNAEVELKENASLYASNNGCRHINFENNSCYPNVYLANNQLSEESVTRASVEDNDTNCDLDFTNPVRSTELSDVSQFGYAALSNKSLVSKDAISNVIVAYSDTSEEYMELPDKESQPGQTVITNVSRISKNIKSNNITIYRDSDEEDSVDNIADKYYSESHSNNVNSKLDKTHIQTLELTAPIPTFLLSSHLHTEEQKKQKGDDINNLDTNYMANCSNVSMEITEAISRFAKSAASDLQIFEQVPTILQNSENAKWDTANNTDNTIFSKNLRSNIVSKQTQDVNCANDSMVLTSVIQPFTDVTGIGMCCTNNTAFNISMEMTTVSPKIHEKNACNGNTVRVNDLKKDQTDKTEIFNDVLMEMTKPINTILPSGVYNKENLRVNELISRDDRTTFFHNESMEMTKAVSIKSRQEITDTITSKSLFEENAHGGKDVNISACFNEGSRVLCQFMEFTEAVPVPLYHERTYNAAHVAQSIDKSMCGGHKNNRTEFFNNASIEITKSLNNVLPLNNDKENLGMHELKNDRTILSHDVSMEITTAVSSRNQKEITQSIIYKSMSEENPHEEKDTNGSACFNEGTRLLCKSMEFTEAVPNSLHREEMFDTTRTTSILFSQTLPGMSLHADNFAGIALQTGTVANKSIQDVSMEITAAVPSTINFAQDVTINKTENLIISKDVGFQHITTNNLIKSKEGVTKENYTISKEIMETENIRHDELSNVFATQSPVDNLDHSVNANVENTSGRKRMSDENGKSYAKRVSNSFMKFQSSQENDVHSSPGTNDNYINSFSQTLSKMSLPADNFAGIALQTVNTIANKSIQDISMQITAAVPSTINLAQDVTINKTENLIISKDVGFQHITTNNLIKSKEGVTKENYTISKEIMETENIRHDELSNVFATQSPLDNLDHSVNANVENASGRKRMSDEDGKSYPKRVRNSFMEFQFSQENDVHSSPGTNDNYVNDAERNEHFVKDVKDHTRISNSNLRDSLNEISEYSFLRKSLSENSLMELQSIEPPSFLCLANEEKNSSHEVQHEFQSPTIADVPANNITGSECLIDSRKSIASDHFTILREKEKPINIENHQAKDCHKSITVNKTEDNQEANCQAITKTIINDNRLKSNYYTTENINEESVLPMNAKDGKAVTVQDIKHCASPIIKEIEVIDEDQIDERACTQKKINENAKLQNNIKEKRQYSDVEKRQEIDEYSNRLERTRAVIEDEIEPEKYHKTNFNSKVKLQSIEPKDECATERLVAEQYVSTIEEESLAEQDPFLTLSQRLETHAAREDCIWNVYHKNIDRKMIIFGFMSNSLLIVTFLLYDLNNSEENLIKEIKIISRVSDNAGVLIRIAHRLISEKINAEILTNLYETHEDVLPMLNFISQDVKLVMDFMFDLRRLDDLNLMEIFYDEISFVSRSKRMDIILRVTFKVKGFDKLTSNDINVRCLLGRIKETDIKNLIKNIKRDHKFLRRYMNDVKDYIDIMEETFK